MFIFLPSDKDIYNFPSSLILRKLSDYFLLYCTTCWCLWCLVYWNRNWV